MLRGGQIKRVKLLAKEHYVGIVRIRLSELNVNIIDELNLKQGL